MAMGEKCSKEFKIAFQSLRLIDKNIDITVYTDADLDINKNDSKLHIVRKELFTDIKSFRIEMLCNSPYDKNLYVDTDVFFLKKFDEIFDILQRVDIAASQTYSNKDKEQNIPEAFPIFNSGVIVFNKNEITRKFFIDWLQRFSSRKETQKYDEPAFREAVFFQKDIQFSILPIMCNFRAEQAQRVSDQVRILHGRGGQLICASEKINTVDGNRLYLPTGEVTKL